MATLTIRKLDDSVKAKLRVRAAEHGRSMEEEVREILESAVQIRLPQAAQEKPRSFYQSIRRHLAEAGIDGIELEIPPRGPMREPPDFNRPESGANDDE